MASKKPILLHTGRSLSKDEKRRRQEQEDIYRVGRLRLVPPDELSERAKLKFNQIVAEAFWLDELSVDLLAAYCHAWDRWLDCVEAMNGTTEVIINDGKAKQNPYRLPLRTYVAMLEDLSGKLALGNVDRLKLSLPVEKEEKEKNPFEEFMTDVG